MQRLWQRIETAAAILILPAVIIGAIINWATEPQSQALPTPVPNERRGPEKPPDFGVSVSDSWVEQPPSPQSQPRDFLKELEMENLRNRVSQHVQPPESMSEILGIPTRVPSWFERLLDNADHESNHDALGQFIDRTRNDDLWGPRREYDDGNLLKQIEQDRLQNAAKQHLEQEAQDDLWRAIRGE